MICLTVEQASALKGAASMGLAFFRRHERGRRDLPTVQAAIDEVRRQMTEITGERKTVQRIVYILEEVGLGAQRFIVGVYENRQLAMRKAERMAKKRGTGLKGWRLGDMDTGLAGWCLCDKDDETAWTYDGQWYYTVTERSVLRAEGGE